MIIVMGDEGDEGQADLGRVYYTAVQGSAVARCRALHPGAGRRGPHDWA